MCMSNERHRGFSRLLPEQREYLKVDRRDRSMSEWTRAGILPELRGSLRIPGIERFSVESMDKSHRITAQRRAESPCDSSIILANFPSIGSFGAAVGALGSIG